MRKHSLNKKEFVQNRDTFIPTWHSETLEKIRCGKISLLRQLFIESSNVGQSTHDWPNGTGITRQYTLYPTLVAPPMASAVQKKMCLPRGYVAPAGAYGILSGSI